MPNMMHILIIIITEWKYTQVVLPEQNHSEILQLMKYLAELLFMSYKSIMKTNHNSNIVSYETETYS